ncbi:MAG: hypothetical protein IJX78_01145 [Bacilli bacterium]|nr:hypothetical protein [Bacilli bacterium]
MKLLDLYKKGKTEYNKLTTLEIPKKISLKSSIFSLIFMIIICIPFILLIASFLTLFSPVRVMFWITLVLVYIFLAISYASSAAFNVTLLKNYIETEEIKQIDTKAIFVNELLNPLILIASIVINFTICYYVM